MAPRTLTAPVEGEIIGTPSTALASAQSQALAAPLPPAAFTGREDVDDLDDDDVYAARLTLAQDTSPQVKKREDAYIEGLEPGQFFNSITGENYGDKVTIAVIKIAKRAAIFDDGGKIVERLDWDDPRCISPGEDENGKWIKPEAARIFDFLVIRVVDGVPDRRPLALSCKKTGFIPAKRFNSLLKNTPGAKWDTLYTLSSSFEKGEVNSYFVPKFAYLSMAVDKRKASPEVVAYCQAIYEAGMRGRVQIADDTPLDETDRESDDTPY